jgi:hypothetical protein
MGRSTSRRGARLGRAQRPTLIPAGVASNVPTVTAPEDPLRRGMPAMDAIHGHRIAADARTVLYHP